MPRALVKQNNRIGIKRTILAAGKIKIKLQFAFKNELNKQHVIVVKFIPAIEREIDLL